MAEQQEHHGVVETILDEQETQVLEWIGRWYTSHTALLRGQATTAFTYQELLLLVSEDFSHDVQVCLDRLVDHRVLERYDASEGDSYALTDTGKMLLAVVPIATNNTVDLQARGIDEAQAADLRARLATFAEDWEHPDMDVYDSLQ